MKLIGYVDMKKTEGKVLFVTDEASAPAVGQTCDKVFLYGDLSKKVDRSSIGKDLVVSYGCGYNGKAYVQDISVK